MKELLIKKTKNTPQIEFDAQKGLLTLSGKSYPENSLEFYQPVLDWIDNYFNGYAKLSTTINFRIKYLNSSSTNLFFEIFDLIDSRLTKNEYLEINWIYDEVKDSLEEVGGIFKENYKNINFNLRVITTSISTIKLT